MLDNLMDYAIGLMLSLPGIIFALTVHEYAHALVSTKLGDPLPRASGRLTLNPFRHIDILGFLMLLVLRFGWAKPVMIDPRYYKHKKLDTALTSLAGPLANFITAFLLVLGEAGFTYLYAAVADGLPSFWRTAMSVVYTMLDYTVVISVGLGIFNLIPISPLDGSKVLLSFLPLRAYEKVLRAERVGMAVLLLLMFNIPGRLLNIVGVPYIITRWFDLSLYLETARYAVIGSFEWFWAWILSLFGV